MNKIMMLTAMAATSALVVGCNASSGAPDTQFELCEVSSFQDAGNTCKEGQLVSVLPDSWGNDQLPLLIASAVCNFSHPVVTSKGGVVCVFTKKRYDNLMAAAKAKAAAQPK